MLLTLQNRKVWALFEIPYMPSSSPRMQNPGWIMWMNPVVPLQLKAPRGALAVRPGTTVEFRGAPGTRAGRWEKTSQCLHWAPLLLLKITVLLTLPAVQQTHHTTRTKFVFAREILFNYYVLLSSSSSQISGQQTNYCITVSGGQFSLRLNLPNLNHTHHYSILTYRY